MSDSYPPPPDQPEQSPTPAEGTSPSEPIQPPPPPPPPASAAPPPPPPPGWSAATAPVPQQPAPGYPVNPDGTVAPPPNNLVWAILTTVFCFAPFGIVSIVYAAKVDSLYSSGRVAEAYSASKSARTWAIVSAASVAVVMALFLLILLVAALIGTAASN